MLSKIGALTVIVLVLSASYTLWKSGVQSDARTELATEINQQTEVKVKNDEAEVEQIFIGGSDDAVIDSIVSGVLAADQAENDYSGELRSDYEDTGFPVPVDTQGETDVELQDRFIPAPTTEENARVAPRPQTSDRKKAVVGDVLLLSDEEMKAAQVVLGDGCISELIYLKNGLTETVETCPEK